jgi:hypothetical protein
MKFISRIQVAGFLIMTVGMPFLLKAQGCSDAGFCTLSTLKPTVHDSTTASLANLVKAGVSLGKADNTISIIGSYWEYQRNFSERFSLNVRMTGLVQQGNGITSYGLSDIFVNSSFSFKSKASVVVGVKIPLSDGNKKMNGISLPMDYQSSLGTIDFITGINFFLHKVQMSLAWQQPVTQNSNTFFATNYPADSELSRFQSTNKFIRKADVLMRISYPLRLSQKWVLTTGALPLYHIDNDEYTTEQGATEEISGSKGLTLNVTAFLDYRLSANSTLQLNAGVPLLVREVRPDGLTRSIIATLEYSFRF